jgi:hypothetical protein
LEAKHGAIPCDRGNGRVSITPQTLAKTCQACQIIFQFLIYFAPGLKKSRYRCNFPAAGRLLLTAANSATFGEHREQVRHLLALRAQMGCTICARISNADASISRNGKNRMATALASFSTKRAGEFIE